VASYRMCNQEKRSPQAEVTRRPAQQIVAVVALSGPLVRSNVVRWGSLRADDSAAQLNSMLYGATPFHIVAIIAALTRLERQTWHMYVTCGSSRPLACSGQTLWSGNRCSGSDGEMRSPRFTLKTHLPFQPEDL
jgi:hypothetical protein